MTCRCHICGVKNAGRVGRGSYVRCGHQVSESERMFKARKREGRRLRRRYEKAETRRLAMSYNT